MGEVDASLSGPERQWRSVLLLGWPIALLGAPVIMAMDVPLCAFRHLSGFPCPLCGGTSACAALVEGNFLAAWQANPGILLLLALAAVQTLQLGSEAWTGNRVQHWRLGVKAWHAGFAVLVAGWILRLFGLA